ncbi:hypothetical protein K5X82_07555 [Halosquirtibacter xylanolyticus]|uniref:hypothetical protein n=1 Tax=Halosquirtibacter xylanolyticus TaxID=3374599 RepID=UPI003747D20B|nr:hypothetical protein K5X82_07555 [Prolixibacteraceae bacterium]
MKKALLLKEWKKLKWGSLFMFCSYILLLGYEYLKVDRAIRFTGLEHLWDVIVNRNQFLFSELKYFPLFCGVVFALAQFVPEMTQKRIKLSLHLPMKESTIIWTMLGFGYVSLTIFFLFQVVTLTCYLQTIFPIQIIASTLITYLPWLLSGLAGYGLCAWICLEPSWKRRILNLIITGAILPFFFLTSVPGAYSNALLYCFCIPLYVLGFGFLSVYRFKTGVQDNL